MRNRNNTEKVNVELCIYGYIPIFSKSAEKEILEKNLLSFKVVNYKDNSDTGIVVPFRKLFYTRALNLITFMNSSIYLYGLMEVNNKIQPVYKFAGDLLIFSKSRKFVKLPDTFKRKFKK